MPGSRVVAVRALLWVAAMAATGLMVIMPVRAVVWLS